MSKKVYTFRDAVEWSVRYHRYLFSLYATRYERSPERDAFLAMLKNGLVEKLAPTHYDNYKIEILGVWDHGYLMRENLSVTLDKIERVRQDYHSKQDAAHQYPDHFGEWAVGDFVQEERKRKILSFLLQQKVLTYFFSAVMELENNRKSGGLRDVTEVGILLKVKNLERIARTNYAAHVGLKWTGAKIQERTKAVYNYLVQKGYILKQTKLEDFRTAFGDQPVDNRIAWQKTPKHILLFIEAFTDKEFLFLPRDLVKKRQRSKELFVLKAQGKIEPEQDSELKGALREVHLWLYPRIAACFKNKTGKPFTTRNLTDAHNDLYNKGKYPKSADEFGKLADSIARM